MTPNQIAARCTAVLKQNKSKVIPTLAVLFLMTQFFMLTVLAVCAAFIYVAKSVSLLAVLALFFAMILFMVSTNYGLSHIMLKFSRGEQTVIGHLFSGFLCIKRLAVPALVQLALFMIPVVALSFWQAEAITATPPGGALLSEAQIFATVAVLIAGALLYVPFLFVPFLLLDNPYARVIPLLAQSARLMVRNFGFVFVSVVKSLWKYLLLGIGIVACSVALPVEVSSLFSFASTVLGYVLYAKCMLALALCYGSLCAPTQAVSEEYWIE